MKNDREKDIFNSESALYCCHLACCPYKAAATYVNQVKVRLLLEFLKHFLLYSSRNVNYSY